MIKERTTPSIHRITADAMIMIRAANIRPDHNN